jgi:hypothetical protein
MKFKLLIYILVVQFFAISAASATPTQRGFQVPLYLISPEVLSELKDNWGINSLRIPIGNNSEMDGSVGEAYDAMMEEQFSLLDEKLPIIQEAGLTMVFNLYSPPGGFTTRNSPAHYAMFSDSALQEDFIETWQEIMLRYGSNPTISEFDLLNEPALNESLRGLGVDDWNALLVRTVAAIRETNPNVKLVVKSLYGSPLSLKELPILEDENIIYGYNAYYYNAYQHSGIGSVPFTREPPKGKDVLPRIRTILSSFYEKVFNLVENKNISAAMYPPKLTVGEVAISACAKDAGEFLGNLMNALEADDSVAGRAKRQKKINDWISARKKLKRGFKKTLPRPIFNKKDFRLDVEHASYYVHAYGESQIWDPTYSCDSEGNLSPAVEETDRTTVTKAFFSRN